MEYVEASRSTTASTRGAVPPEQALAILEQVGRGDRPRPRRRRRPPRRQAVEPPGRATTASSSSPTSGSRPPLDVSQITGLGLGRRHPRLHRARAPARRSPAARRPTSTRSPPSPSRCSPAAGRIEAKTPAEVVRLATTGAGARPARGLAGRAPGGRASCSAARWRRDARAAAGERPVRSSAQPRARRSRAPDADGAGRPALTPIATASGSTTTFPPLPRHRHRAPGRAA